MATSIDDVKRNLNIVTMNAQTLQYKLSLWSDKKISDSMVGVVDAINRMWADLGPYAYTKNTAWDDRPTKTEMMMLSAEVLRLTGVLNTTINHLTGMYPVQQQLLEDVRIISSRLKALRVLINEHVVSEQRVRFGPPSKILLPKLGNKVEEDYGPRMAWKGLLPTLTFTQHMRKIDAGECCQVHGKYLTCADVEKVRDDVEKKLLSAQQSLDLFSKMLSELSISRFNEVFDKMMSDIPTTSSSVDGCECYQADSEESGIGSSVKRVVGSVASQGAGFLGRAVQDVFGTPMGFDSPAVVGMQRRTMALPDVPVEVEALAFTKETNVPDGNAVIQESNDSGLDILTRCKVRSLLNVHAWTPSQAAGALLYRFSVSPVVGGFGTTVDNKISTPLSYFSDLFEYWSGELAYEIEVIATQVHQGQLFVSFMPNSNIPVQTMANSTNTLNATIDIATSNTTTFVVPYVSDSDLRQCSTYWLAEDDRVGPFDSIGTISVFVQTALTAPPSVAPQVWVNVWVKAADSFKFSVPRTGVALVRSDGVWQGEGDEVIKNTETAPPAGEPMSGLVVRNPIDYVTTVDTADTSNIVGRTYLIPGSIGSTWTTASSAGALVRAIAVPQDLIGNAVNSIKGLTDYHEFLRTGFEVTIRFAASRFYNGLGILYFQPGPALTGNQSVVSLTQLPHAFVNIGQQSEATLRVPWTTFRRIQRTADAANWGSVYFRVINPLLSPPDAAASISFTQWYRPLSPYIGVKKPPAAAEYQAESMIGNLPTRPVSGTAVDEAVGGRCWAGEKPTPGNFIGAHHNVLDLMRRFDWAGVAVRLPTPTPGTFVSIFETSSSMGRNHKKLYRIYRFWSGSWRLRLLNPSSTYATAFIGVVPQFGTVGVTGLSTVVATVDFNNVAYNGVGILKVSDLTDSTNTFQIPFYHHQPLVPCIEDGARLNTIETDVGRVTVFVYRGSMGGTQDVDLFPWYAAGDDFKFHFPLPFPVMRRVPLVGELFMNYDDGGKIEVYNPKKLMLANYQGDATGDLGGWVRDLTTEGVEPNPGPEWINNILRAYIQDLTKDQVDAAKGKIEEVRVRAAQLEDALSKRLLPAVIWCMDFLLNIHVLNSYYAGDALKALAIASIGAKLYHLHDSGRQILKELKEVFDPLQFQGFGDSKNVTATVATALFTGVVGVLGKTAGTDDIRNIRQQGASKYNEICKKLSITGGAIRGAKELWQFVRAGAELGVDYFLGGNPDKTWYEDNKLDLERWISAFDLLRSSGGTTNNKMFVGRRGERPYDKLCEMEKFACEVRMKGPNVDRFPQVYLRTAEDIIRMKAEAQAIMNNAVGRFEPVGILLSGGPGVGKSYLSTNILPVIVLNELELAQGVAHARERVYAFPRDADQKYYDGYQGQEWACIDDFGQSTSDDDFEQIIHIISSSTMPVPMAQLEQKTTVFNTPFVCCDTNLTHFTGLKTVKQPSAVLRRFPIKVRVVGAGQKVAEPGVVKRVDVVEFQRALERNAKAQQPLTVCDMVDLFWDFYEYSPDMSAYGDKLPCRDLVDRIKGEYLRRAGCHTKLNSALDYYFQAGDSDQDGGVPDLFFLNGEGHADMLNRAEDPDVFVDCPQYVTAEEFFERMTPEARTMLLRKWLQDKNVYVTADRVATLARDNKTPISQEEYNRTIPAGNVLLKMSDDDDGGKWVNLQHFIESCLGFAINGFICYMVYKLVKSMLERYFCADFQGAYDKQQGVRAARGKAAKGNTGRAGAVFQGGDVQNCVAKNLRRINCGGNYRVFGIALDAKHMLIPKHFYDKFNERMQLEVDAALTLEQLDRQGNVLNVVPWTMQMRNVECVPFFGKDTDVLLVSLVGCNINHARKIDHLLKDEADWRKVFGSQRVVFMPDLGERVGTNGTANFSSYKTFDSKRFFQCKVDTDTVAGDCGRPYFLSSASDGHPLLGFHSVGKPGHNLTLISPICAEDVMRAKQLIADRMYVPVAVEEVELQIESSGAPSKYWKGGMENHGQCELNGQKLERFSPPKTMFKRSPLRHEDWSDNFLPSQKKVVTLGDEEIHPLITNAQKYTPVASKNVTAFAQEAALGLYLKQIPYVPEAGPLEEYETLNGMDEMPAIVLKTSPGYLSAYYANGKKELFDVVGGELDENGEMEPQSLFFSDTARDRIIPLWDVSFVQRLNDLDAGLAEGKAPFVPWVSTLKDELRPKVKVAAGKTRVFEQPGLEFTILMRRYFGHFTCWYKRNAGFRLMHGIGKDKDSVWRAYYEELSRFEDGFDLDYSNYDGTVHPAAFDFFLAVTDKYYGDANKVERHALIHTLRHSIQIVGKDLVEAQQGNKSGNPLTDVFNSITNAWFLLVCYTNAKAQMGEGSIDDFYDNVSALTYGDDVILTVSESMSPYFNRKTCANVGTLLGYKITAANKGSELVPVESLDDLTFLKSPFVQSPPLVLAPLPKEVIYRELMWEHKGNAGDTVVLKQRIVDGLRMMYHHGRDDFELLKQQLKDLGYSDYVEDVDWKQLRLEHIEKQDVGSCVSALGVLALPSYSGVREPMEWTDDSETEEEFGDESFDAGMYQAESLDRVPTLVGLWRVWVMIWWFIANCNPLVLLYHVSHPTLLVALQNVDLPSDLLCKSRRFIQVTLFVYALTGWQYLQMWTVVTFSYWLWDSVTVPCYYFMRKWLRRWSRFESEFLL